MTNLLAKPTLRVDDVACFFDVSPSWFDRTVMRKPQRTLKAVDGLSFVIPRGTTFSIVGESGCGKSTLARLVVGLYQPTRGRLSFANGSGRDGLVRTQMIFQDPFASLNPRWRVGAIIAEP
ncbi:ATP-binding cassette domain-containing protein, partial [Mesorhizobium sp. M8A.F.Ca.ET.021.01.1.1]